MRLQYQVLTTPTADTPGTSVILHFHDKRYFFGQVAEGTQRALIEQGGRLQHLTEYFITGRTEWATHGGLIGMILTQADALINQNAALEAHWRARKARRDEISQEIAVAEAEGTTKGVPRSHPEIEPYPPQVDCQLTIHGGRNLTHVMATARRFVFRKGVPTLIQEYDSESMARRDREVGDDPFVEPTWSDSNIKVWAMPIRPSSSQKSGGVCESRSQSPRKRSLDEFQENNAAEDPLDKWAKDQYLRQSIVTDMFDSDWKLDTLVETRLADVKMPAAMFVRNPETKDLEPYKGPMPGDNMPLPDITVLVRQPWPGASIARLPHTSRCNEAVSYIVRNKDARGKFDAQKAQQLKVKKGPSYAALTRGESVLSEDGQTITPDMVLGPSRPGKAMAIIDLPAPEYVDNLVNRPEWDSPTIAKHLEAFIWILGPGVGEHPRLQEFIAKMSRCKHMVSSTDYCPNYLAMRSIASSSIRLARVRSENYSIPVHDNVTLPQPGTPTAGSTMTQNAIRSSPMEPLEPGVMIEMEPGFSIDRSEVMPRLNPAAALLRMPRAVEKRLASIHRRIERGDLQKDLDEFLKDLPGGDAEIIALGTGSSAPSKYRNVSGTLVHVPGQGYYLLDCGENTLGQLKRVFEPEQLREVLQNLRVIWISHLHADHHLGTVSVIKAWYRENYGHDSQPSSSDSVEMDMAKILREKRLFVVSDQMMVNWLEEYAAVEDYGFHKLVPLAAHPVWKSPSGDSRQVETTFVYRHCRDDGSYPGLEGEQNEPATTILRFDDDSSPLTPLLRSATGLSEIRTTRVSHCRGSLGVCLVFPDGFMVSFSGDCRPSSNLAAIGRGSTVLIHEATFQDNMQGNAIAKKHSTMAEALEVGRQMEARAIFLTHFSQRYQKMAQFEQNTGASEQADEAAVSSSVANREPDIPVDNEEPDDASAESSVIKVPSGSAALQKSPGKRAPVNVAFDYMRAKVRDFPITQAFRPAVERLFAALEKAAIEEAALLKQKHEEQKALKGQKKKQKASAKTPSVVRPAGPSAWSASESESGWTVSESESETERKTRDKGRSRSPTMASIAH